MDYRIKTNDLDIEIEVKRTNDSIVNKLVQYRKKMGLTQQDIADATGIHRANVARIEGKKNVATLDSLMKYANCLNLQLSIDVSAQRDVEETGRTVEGREN